VAYQGVMPSSPQEIRKAAANAIGNLVTQQGDIVPWATIAAGFRCNGENVLFANKVRGIFKPAQLNDGAALSIRTSRPRLNRPTRYNDELIEDGLLRYCFQGDDPDSADNRFLHKAWQHQLPLIYFFGLAEAIYQVFYPVVITKYDPRRMEAFMAWKPQPEFPANDDLVLNDPHQALGLRTATNRLHQARFRANVFSAYRFRCAFSQLEIGSLLKPVKILDAGDATGVSTVNNAICMSVLHKAAFDANLIGIDHRGAVKASRLLNEPRHSMLAAQLGKLDGHLIAVPKTRAQRPSPDLLNERFKLFTAAQK
jgi:putative restriction endonuclease